MPIPGRTVPTVSMSVPLSLAAQQPPQVTTCPRAPCPRVQSHFLSPPSDDVHLAGAVPDVRLVPDPALTGVQPVPPAQVEPLPDSASQARGDDPEPGLAVAPRVRRDAGPD